MPGHLRVPELTGDAPATLSAAALNGLLRGELGFTGVIISDALEMRAVSDLYGIPEAAVLAVAAGTDLLCFGRDAAEDSYLAVRRALSEAVASGRLPAERLTEAQQNVARLRTWLADAAPQRRAQLDGTGLEGTGLDGTGLDGTGLDGTGLDVGRPAGAAAHIGLVAARRAVRASSITTGAAPGPLADPVVVELEAQENIAVGDVPWGLGPWVPAASIQRVPAGLAVSEAATVAEAALVRAAQAADRGGPRRPPVSGGAGRGQRADRGAPGHGGAGDGAAALGAARGRASGHLRRGAGKRAGRGGGPGAVPVSWPGALRTPPVMTRPGLIPTKTVPLIGLAARLVPGNLHNAGHEALCPR